MSAHPSAGRFDEISFESKALEGNPLGDPHARKLWVYVPPGYDDGSYDRFWEDFRSGRPPLAKKSDPFLLNTYCMAACYSADEDGTVRMPFDIETGELLPDVWARWLEWDPVRMVERRA